MALPSGTRLGSYEIQSALGAGIISADGRTVFTADVTTTPDFHAAAPRQLFTLPKETLFSSPAPDFQRFLAAVPIAENTTSSITIVFDWVGALKSR